MSILNQIRQRGEPQPFGRQLVNSILALVLGIALGLFSKWLDCTPSNEQPWLLEYLDVRNVLGRFSIWLLLGLWISTVSRSSARAAVNVFLFFAGMVSSYYLYSRFAAGFFPKSYAIVWFGFTAVSPLLAAVCWYAKGQGGLPFALSMALIAVMFYFSFACGWLYAAPRSLVELLSFVCVIILLRRQTVARTALMAVMGTALGFIFCLVSPFHFG